MSRHLSHDDYLIEVGESVIETLRAYQDGSISIVDAVRALSIAAKELGLSPLEEPLSTFVVVDSESDDLPGQEQRALWAASSLNAVDDQINRLERLYQEQVMESGHKLLSLFTKRVRNN